MLEEALSLAAFHSETRRHRRDINSAWNLLSDARTLFNQEEDIWPDQCDSVKNSVYALSKPVRNFSALLDNASYLPATAVPFRYSLIMTLHVVEDLIDELMMLITRFRMLCQTPTSETIKRRREIERILDELEQGCEEILPNVDGLLLQVRSSKKEHQPSLI
jgi:hypothetical protein